MRRPPLPDRLTPAERDFYLELRRLVDIAGYSFRTLENVTAGNQSFFSKSQWGRWLNGQSLPPRRAVRALAGRLAADDIDAGHLADLWNSAFAPAPGLPDLQQPILSIDPALVDTGPLRGHGVPGPALPRELPPGVPGFTGRADELAALTGLLDRAGEQGSGAVVITAIGGTAGVGKTALAVHWAHQVVNRFPDGQLYVNLQGYDSGQPVPATDALAGFLRALGVPSQDIPLQQYERAARYRSLLAGKRMLVVLDNARSADQVRPLLPGAVGCAVVVTSRDTLAGLAARDGATRLDLDLLLEEDAVALLRTLIGARVDAEPVAAAELAGHCCRLPLALRVAAELAASRPDVPLAALTAELADLGTRLDLLETGGDASTQVRAVFSWSCRHLEPDATRTFRLLGLHPGPGFEPYAAAALAGTTVQQARRALNTLASAHLIQPAGPRRYGMHDLLRGYARELAHTLDNGGEVRAAMTRLFDHYLYAAAAAMDTLFPADRHYRPRVPRPATPVQPLPDPAAAREWLECNRAALVAAAGHAAQHGWPRHATRLAATFARYLRNGGHFHESLAIFHHALDAARRTGDQMAEATALTGIGALDWAQGRNQQAADYFRRAVALFHEAGDRLGEAQALNHLGGIETDLGCYEHADRHLQEAVAISRQGGDRVGEASALGYLGRAQARQGRYQEAADYDQQALDLSREIGDSQGEAWALTRLGATDLRLGRCQSAAGYLQQALTLFRDMDNRPDETEILVLLGEVDVELGWHGQAASNYEQALAVIEKIDYPRMKARTLNNLGEVLFRSGDVAEARARHAAALRLSSEGGSPRQQARAHSGLARACGAEGDPVQARHHWQQALTRYDALGAPEADEIRARLAAAGNNGHDGGEPADQDDATTAT